MGNDKFPTDDHSSRDFAAERAPKKAHHPDAELHLDGEEDALNDDELDIEEDSETLFGTRGTSPGIAKP